MGMLRVMSRRGDDMIRWERQKLETGDPEAEAAVREAERIFGDHTRRGAAAFRVTHGQSPVRIDVFDAEAEQIVVIPRVVGG